MKKKRGDFLLKWITTFKILRDRSIGWVSAFNFLMIGYLFLKNFTNKKIGWIVIIGIFILFLTIFDYIFILPREQEYYLKKNLEWQKKMDRLSKKK